MSYVHLLYDFCQIPAEAAGDGGAGLVDLLAGDGGAGHAGGQIGNDRDAEQRQTAMRRGQRLRHGRHADGVAAERADGADLRRSLKLRAGHEEIDALLHADAELVGAGLCQRTQLRRVHPGDVKKPRAEFVDVPAAQRACAVELDLVGDQHEIAGAVALVHAASRVRHDQRPDAQQLQKPHRLRQLLEVIALIAVEPARQAHEPLARERPEDELARVAGRGGGEEVGDLVVVDLYRVLQLSGKRPERGAENHRDLRLERHARADIVGALLIKCKRFVHKISAFFDDTLIIPHGGGKVNGRGKTSPPR